jgi:hypothetical protein
VSPSEHLRTHRDSTCLRKAGRSHPLAYVPSTITMFDVAVTAASSEKRISSYRTQPTDQTSILQASAIVQFVVHIKHSCGRYGTVKSSQPRRRSPTLPELPKSATCMVYVREIKILLGFTSQCTMLRVRKKDNADSNCAQRPRSNCQHGR